MNYVQFKKNLNLENYLILMKERRLRRYISEFRSGTTRLCIETGRWQQQPREQRTCPLCTFDIEDEVHVLFRCKFYDALRKQLFNRPAVKSMLMGTEVDNFLALLGKDKDATEWNYIAIFYYNMFKRRKKLCRKHHIKLL